MEVSTGVVIERHIYHLSTWDMNCLWISVLPSAECFPIHTVQDELRKGGRREEKHVCWEAEHTCAELVARPHLAREFGKCGLELVALCQTPNQTLCYHRRKWERALWRQPEASVTFTENDSFSNVAQCLFKIMQCMQPIQSLPLSLTQEKVKPLGPYAFNKE